MLELTKVENIFCREEDKFFQNGVGLKSDIDCYIYPEGRRISKELLHLQFPEGRILLFEKQSPEEFHTIPYLNVYADFALNRGLGLAKSIVKREASDDFPMSDEYLNKLPDDIELDYGYVPNYNDVNFPTNHHFHPYGFICNVPNMFDEWESLRLLNQLIKSFPLRKYEFFTVAIKWKINKQDDEYSSSDFRIYGTANGKYGYTHMIHARYGLTDLNSLIIINDFGFNKAYGKYEYSKEEESVKRSLFLKDMYARRVDNVYNYEEDNFYTNRPKKFKELMSKGVTLAEFFESEYEIYDELECLEIDENISLYEDFFGVGDFGVHKDNINKIIYIFKKYASKEEICKIISFYLSVKQMQANPGVGCGNNIIFCINKKQKEMIAQPIYKLFYILDEVCVGEFKNKSLGNGVCSLDSSIYSNVVLDDPYLFSSKKTGYNNPFDNFIKGDIRIIVVEDKEYNEKIRDKYLEDDEVAPYGYMIHDVVYIRKSAEIVIDELNNRLHILPEKTDDFVEKLYSFVRSDYEKSKLDMAVYADYLLFKIMYNYYKVPRRPGEKLGADCIPYSNSIGRSSSGILDISVDSVFADIDKLYGLKEVKEFFRRLYKSQKYALENNKNSFEQKNRYHMFFMGNPGTGKTHVARLTARLLYAMGIIREPKLTERKVSDLICRFLGQSQEEFRMLIAEADGGVLFIDEAYELATDMPHSNTKKQYDELVGMIIQEMENNKDIVFVFAGYEKEMKKLYDTNAGFKSRIGYEVIFKDYEINDLVSIFEDMLNQRGYIIDEEAYDSLRNLVINSFSETDFGNVRGIEKLCQYVTDWVYSEIDEASLLDKQDGKIVLYKRHFEALMPIKIDTRIEDLVGIEGVKTKLNEFKNRAIYEKKALGMGINIPKVSRHMVFVGNPGTGKTTVAQVLAQELYNEGVLATNKTIEISTSDLLNYSDNDTPVEKLNKAIMRARGGILFIDEAYGLVNKNSNYGAQIIEALLTAMLDFDNDIIFIFAGYTKEMYDFLESNPGLKSRIGYEITFTDYDVDNLMDIFDVKIKRVGIKVDDDARRRVWKIMQYFQNVEDFGNGRFVDFVISQIITRKSVNVSSKDMSNITDEELCLITKPDVPDIAYIVENMAGGKKISKPIKRTKEEERRILVHEIGHALVGYLMDPENLKPSYINLRADANTIAHVQFSRESLPISENAWKAQLAVTLGGRCAEKCCIGDVSMGCQIDFRSAQDIANSMVNEWAMGELFVTTPKELILEAEKNASLIIEKYKGFIIELVNKILDKTLTCIVNKILDGDVFVDLLHEYMKENGL